MGLCPDRKLAGRHSNWRCSGDVVFVDDDSGARPSYISLSLEVPEISPFWLP